MQRWVKVVAFGVAVVLAVPGQLLAVSAGPGNPTSASTNWGLTEQNIGLGGDITSSSTNYSSGGSTLGDTAVGNSASANFQTNSGLITAQEPTLSMIVNTSSINFGQITSGTSATATATFSVIDYTSYGYVVQIVGTPPTMGGHQLTPLATDTASNAVAEQFGMNLRVNSSPVAFGADPVWTPSSSFSYGVAGDGVTGTYGSTRPYTIANNYRFNAGEVIASSPKTSGETDYTISFLANVAPLTQAGRYAGSLAIVATGTY